jgi:hypothetical protein
MNAARICFAALAILAGLAGCDKPVVLEVPAGSICVDGLVWIPRAGTSVAIPVRDNNGFPLRCVPVTKEQR